MGSLTLRALFSTARNIITRRPRLGGAFVQHVRSGVEVKVDPIIALTVTALARRADDLDGLVTVPIDKNVHRATSDPLQLVRAEFDRRCLLYVRR